MSNVFSLSNPPSAPLKKKKAEARFAPPLEWRDRARRNLAHEFSAEELKACLREAEEQVVERRRRRQREAEERFLWLKEDFVEKELEGPFYFPDGTKFYL